MPNIGAKIITMVYALGRLHGTHVTTGGPYEGIRFQTLAWNVIEGLLEG